MSQPFHRKFGIAFLRYLFVKLSFVFMLTLKYFTSSFSYVKNDKIHGSVELLR